MPRLHPQRFSPLDAAPRANTTPAHTLRRSTSLHASGGRSFDRTRFAAGRSFVTESSDAWEGMRPDISGSTGTRLRKKIMDFACFSSWGRDHYTRVWDRREPPDLTLF